jgi:hypothetical protein
MFSDPALPLTSTSKTPVLAGGAGGLPAVFGLAAAGGDAAGDPGVGDFAGDFAAVSPMTVNWWLD